MKENELKITLLVSTYNWKEALKCSLMSAFRQTLLPMEIVIADDGSDEQTRNLIEEMRQISPVPLVHVWHEDKGFRKCEISNKAIAKSQGDYIVQIDGDVILERHFIEDHAALAEKGYFVCGSRVHLDSRTSNLILSGKIRIPRIFHLPIGYFLNSLREAHLRNFFAKRYGRKLDHMRGCNMAFWKDNFIQVNGYNEDLTQWGHEDSELVHRLHFLGVQKKYLKMGGVVYHLHHQLASRSNEQQHWDAIDYVKLNRICWTKNGINKYL